MTFITFIVFVVLLVYVLGLRSRVSRLEDAFLGKQVDIKIPQPIHPDTLKQWSGPQPIAVAPGVAGMPYQGRPINMGPTAVDRFTRWLQEDWLLKLGALLLLIGFGWLTTYAFLNNWIGPAGRIALGEIGGIIFLGLGHWRIKKWIHQGGIFLVLGSTIIILTTFAAREIYDFFTPLSALFLMFLSTAFVALVSVKYRSRSLALVSLILAGIAPLLTVSVSVDYVTWFTYLLVVTLGAIWIAVITGQRSLTTAALILVSLYSLPHIFSLGSADKGILLLYAYVFAAVFFITNTAGILKLKDKDMVPDLVTAAGNGLFLLAWILTSAQDEWKSLIIAAWMIVFAVGAFLIFKLTGKREPFMVYAGIGIVMLAAATAEELSGPALTIAYTIESAFISLATYFITRDQESAEKISFLLIGPMILSLTSMVSSSWRTGVLHDDFFVLTALAVVLFGLGLFYFRESQVSKVSKNNKSSGLYTVLMVLGSIYAYIILWLSLHASFADPDMAVMAALFVYTIIGLITYIYGRMHAMKDLQVYGGILLGFVVGRLLLVDVWRMEISGRIITFFIIGALLISTAFIGRKKTSSPVAPL